MSRHFPRTPATWSPEESAMNGWIDTAQPYVDLTQPGQTSGSSFVAEDRDDPQRDSTQVDS